MKKFLVLAAAVVAFSGNAFAQGTASATVTVPVTVVAKQGLNIGTISRDGSQSGNVIRTVSPIAANNTGGAQFAAFTVSGDAFDGLKVTSASSVLNWTSSSSSQVSSVGASAQTTQIIGSNFTFGAYGSYMNPASLRGMVAMNTEFTPEGNVGGIGKIDLAVGGDFTIAPDLQRGNYTGSVDITVAYN